MVKIKILKINFKKSKICTNQYGSIHINTSQYWNGSKHTKILNGTKYWLLGTKLGLKLYITANATGTNMVPTTIVLSSMEFYLSPLHKTLKGSWKRSSLISGHTTSKAFEINVSIMKFGIFLLNRLTWPQSIKTNLAELGFKNQLYIDRIGWLIDFSYRAWIICIYFIYYKL